LENFDSFENLYVITESAAEAEIYNKANPPRFDTAKAVAITLDSEHFAVDGRAVFRLFFARIFYLRFDIRPYRFDGDDRSGRRAIFVSADYAAAHRFLFQLCGNPRPEFFAVVLGFNRAVLRADYDAGQDFGGNAAVVGNCAFDFYQRSGNRRIDLAGIACLPRRDVNVWQAGDDTGSLEMDSANLK
jgi:hypothetical protein